MIPFPAFILPFLFMYLGRNFIIVQCWIQKRYEQSFLIIMSFEPFSISYTVLLFRHIFIIVFFNICSKQSPSSLDIKRWTPASSLILFSGVVSLLHVVLFLLTTNISSARGKTLSALFYLLESKAITILIWLFAFVSSLSYISNFWMFSELTVTNQVFSSFLFL